MSGLTAYPDRTLVDRALERMGASGPLGAADLARDILGLPNAPVLVAERLAVALLGADPRVRQLDDGRWGLVPEASGSPLLDECAFAVVDVETTGMHAAGDDRITDIAVVLVQGSRRELVFESLINPGVPIPSRIAELTGIDDRLVADAPGFRDVADGLLAALASRVFVAHNVRFDWGFVTAEVKRSRDLALAGAPALHRAAGAPAGATARVAQSRFADALFRAQQSRPPPGGRRCPGDGGSAAAIVAAGPGTWGHDAGGSGCSDSKSSQVTRAVSH